MTEQKGSMSKLESNLNALENLVSKLESGQMSIDEAIEAYSSGMKLAASCKKSLEEMTQKVTHARQEASKILGQVSDLDEEDYQNSEDSYPPNSSNETLPF